MANKYFIRKAKNQDIPFLAEVVIAAEKGESDKLSYSTLFNIPEHKVKDLIVAMFNEDYEGCEFSVSSYYVCEYQTELVAGFGAWIEGYYPKPSKIIKSNLISYTFGPASIEFLTSKQDIIKDIIIERDTQSLQFEYLYIKPEHRGKGIADSLIQTLEDNARITQPGLKKAQVQLFANNRSLKVYERNGFRICKTFEAKNSSITNYLPFDKKILMEKKY